MKNTQKGFIIPLLIAIIAVLAIGGGVYVYTQNNQPKIPVDLSHPISVAEVKKICDEQSCSKDTVTIRGNLKLGDTINSLSIDDGSFYVSFTFSSTTSMVDMIKFAEQNYLLKGGSVEAEVTGTLLPQSVFMMKPTFVIGLNPVLISDIKFIKKNKCPVFDKMHGYTTFEESGFGAGDCFDFSNFSLSATDAYQKLLKSTACGNRKATGIVYYENGMKQWAFQTEFLKNEKPPKSNYCFVSLGGVTLGQ